MRRISFLLGYLGLTLALVSGGARIEVTSSMAQQLAVAVRGKDTARVKALLAAGAPANATLGYTRFEDIDSYVLRQRPVLMVALGVPEWQPTCYMGWMAERSRLVPGNPKIVRMLLEAGADPDLRADDPCPPLCFAARHSPTEVVALLLKHGADPRRRHPCASYLHQAAGNYRADTVRVLLRHGADPRQRYGEGATPLYEAVSGEAWPPERQADQVHTVQLLLTANTINTPDHAGTTPLMRAATWGNVPVMKLLISRSASLHAVDDPGYTALMYASRSGTPAGVRYLLERGAQTATEARDGETALTLAAKRLLNAKKEALPTARAVRKLLEDHAAGKRYP